MNILIMLIRIRFVIFCGVRRGMMFLVVMFIVVCRCLRVVGVFILERFIKGVMLVSLLFNLI